MACAPPADIISAVSDSTEGCTLPLVQRSVTPLGAQTASLCSNAGLPFRIHREMLVLQMLRDALRLLGFNFLRGGR